MPWGFKIISLQVTTKHDVRDFILFFVGFHLDGIKQDLTITAIIQKRESEISCYHFIEVHLHGINHCNLTKMWKDKIISVKSHLQSINQDFTMTAILHRHESESPTRSILIKFPRFYQFFEDVKSNSPKIISMRELLIAPPFLVSTPLLIFFKLPTSTHVIALLTLLSTPTSLSLHPIPVTLVAAAMVTATSSLFLLFFISHFFCYCLLFFRTPYLDL